jgi:hypothetical protein
MGEITVVLLGAFAVAGILLIAQGVYAHNRTALGIGIGILLAVIGAWLIGLAGVIVGVVVSAFILRSGRPRTGANGA